MNSLPDKIVAVHQSLQRAGLPHAFGGALALAWCTGRARGTIDIDINVFLGSDAAEAVFAALPAHVEHSEKALAEIRKEGQVRLWLDKSPIDLFLNTTDLHREAAERIRWESFVGQSIPFLSCQDLAVFKTFFNRTKDWADLEEMHAAGTLDVERVTAVLIRYLGAQDERIAQLARLPSRT